MKFILRVLVGFLVVVSFNNSLAFEPSSSPVFSMDPYFAFPNKFRTTGDYVPSWCEIALDGLSDLNAMGSAQFSADQLKLRDVPLSKHFVQEKNKKLE